MIKEDIIILKMRELASHIDYEAQDISYLASAMRCQKEKHNLDDGKHRKNYTNDALATLGDSVLKFILTDHFYKLDPDKKHITTEKQKLENNKTLYRLRKESDIFKYAYNDEGFSQDAPDKNKIFHSKHDVYIEAIIGAIYLDKGMEYCKEWVIGFFKKYSLIE